MDKKTKEKLSNVGKHILIYAVMFFTIAPLLWMLLASFQPNQSIINANKGLFDFVPTVENFVSVITEYDFLDYTWNSFVVAAAATVFSLIIGVPCAYVVARYKMRKASVVVLLVRMIPGISFLLPWFSIFSKLGLRDSYTALILSHMLVALPYIVWTMIPNFENLPRELEEAAWIDGSTQLGAFFVGLVTDNHGVSAGEGGVADIAELLQLHIGQHTDVHRVLHVDTGADAAGHVHVVDHLHRHIHALEHGIDG